MRKNRKAHISLNLLLKSVLFVCFISIAGMAHAQDANSDDVKNHTSVDQNMNHPTTPAQKALVRKKKAEEKEAKRQRKQALKEHMKHQSKAVRKRMKKDYKEAERNNEHKGEPFFKRLFSKKRPK